MHYLKRFSKMKRDKRLANTNRVKNNRFKLVDSMRYRVPFSYDEETHIVEYYKETVPEHVEDRLRLVVIKSEDGKEIKSYDWQYLPTVIPEHTRKHYTKSEWVPNEHKHIKYYGKPKAKKLFRRYRNKKLRKLMYITDELGDVVGLPISNGNYYKKVMMDYYNY